VLGLIEGHLVPLDVALVVRELSQAGFSVLSPSPFPPGSRHHFRFTAANQKMVTLDATAIHCRLTEADADGRLAYVSGFEFASNARTDEAIGVLIDTLASVLSLE
jgi:hypothetical protein